MLKLHNSPVENINMKKLQHTGENQQTPRFTTEFRTKHKYKFTTDKVSDFMRTSRENQKQNLKIKSAQIINKRKRNSQNSQNSPENSQSYKKTENRKKITAGRKLSKISGSEILDSTSNCKPSYERKFSQTPKTLILKEAALVKNQTKISHFFK